MFTFTTTENTEISLPKHSLYATITCLACSTLGKTDTLCDCQEIKDAASWTTCCKFQKNDQTCNASLGVQNFEIIIFEI